MMNPAFLSRHLATPLLVIAATILVIDTLAFTTQSIIPFRLKNGVKITHLTHNNHHSSRNHPIRIHIHHSQRSQLSHDRTISSTSLNLFQTPAGGRHYQLTELEDSETSATDLTLHKDYTVTLGKTDSPLFKPVGSGGTWSEKFVDKRKEGGVDRRLFEMKLVRRFVAGTSGVDGSPGRRASDEKWGKWVKEDPTSTEIGEFEYEVERTYTGEITLVGGSVLAMNGEIHDTDEVLGDRKLGFFDMIDTTEARKEDSVEK